MIFFYISSLMSLTENRSRIWGWIWYGVGSGSGSIVRGAHPRIRNRTTMSRTPNTASELTDQDSDPAPAIFVSDHQDGNLKKNFYVFLLTTCYATFAYFFEEKKS